MSTSIDVILYIADKAPSGIVRIVKRLPPGTAVTKHERDVLLRLTRMLDRDVQVGASDPKSGVFVLHHTPEARDAVITPYGKLESYRVTGEPLTRFLSGRLMQAGDAVKLDECAVRYEDDEPTQEDEG